MKVIKRILTRCLLIVLLSFSVLSVQAREGCYICDHKAIALVLSRTYGIPAQLILAVATVESSSGRGPAARVLNNHFGIEGRNYIATPGFRSRYKQYGNVFSSYLDFCLLLTRKHFYHKLRNNMDCTAWIKAMSKAHYSEVPEEWEHKVFAALSMVKRDSKNETSPLLAIR